MCQDPDRHRLSEISTLWSVVHQAAGATDDDGQSARRLLLHRYGSALHRYLLGALRDSTAADELFQEFSLRFMRGKVTGADPRRGRFRDYVKGVLFHMIADHQRQRAKLPRQVPETLAEPAGEDERLARSERKFLANWREEMLAQSWRELRRMESETGRPYHRVLKYRSENPAVSSQRIARNLEKDLERPFTAAGARQILHRAREKFSDLLLDVVAQTLSRPTCADLEQELIDLDLLQYCRPALRRRRELERE